MIRTQSYFISNLPGVQSISLSFKALAIVSAVVPVGMFSVEGIERSRIEDKLHALPNG
jgi:hypothetical protein